jgi:hypothetical protein
MFRRTLDTLVWLLVLALLAGAISLGLWLGE